MTNFHAQRKRYGTHRNRVRYVGYPREGGTAYTMAFHGRLRLKGVPFSGIHRLYKNVGISPVEVYKSVGKSIISSGGFRGGPPYF